MLRSMYSGISGMKVNQTKLDVIGNNLANVSTTAFKSSQARFKDMLYQNAGYASAPTTVKGGTNAKQVGLGAQLSSINKMMGQGNAMSTGRSLDVCVDGEGYLVVGKGAINGSNAIDNTTHSIKSAADEGADANALEILYTRDGNLTLDKDGNLLTADGYRIMGYNVKDAANTALTYENDGTLTTKYVDADSKELEADQSKLIPLAIPDEVDGQKVRTFEIGKDGLITAVLDDGSRSALGQIAMAGFTNPEGLNAVGGNLVQESSNSGTNLIKTGIIKSGTTDAYDNSKGFGEFIQGALEGSNVDITEQFTDMIVATRAFQAASKMISNGDEILQTITGLVR